MMSEKVNLIGMSRDEFENLVTGWGERRFRARQAMIWIYHKRVFDFSSMTDLSKSFRQTLARNARIGLPKIIDRRRSNLDGTVKYLMELDDGARIESVLMFDGKRRTLCISTQVGCGMGCRFCRTGGLGLTRNLRADEIIGQLMAVEAEIGQAGFVTNLVLMGMGEPLANYEQTLKALKLIVAAEGLMFAARKITLSTCGLVPQIRKLASEKLKIGLAISLNAADDETRNRLMPINRTYSIADVLAAGREWHRSSGKPFTIEYVLLKGVNDSPEDAMKLRRLANGMPVKFNLIPFNPGDSSEFESPDPEDIEKFREIVAGGHFVTSIRASKGQDISGACGQLVAGYESGK